jgi:hypothetical protein
MSETHPPDAQQPSVENSKDEPARSQLFSEICRAMGLFAVANELALQAADFEPELSTHIQRGTRYLFLFESKWSSVAAVG